MQDTARTKALIAGAAISLLSNCAPGSDMPGAIEAADLETCAANTKLTDLQSIGSHNSYKRFIPEAELAMIRLSSSEAAVALDYGHLPLDQQLDLGLRQLELDVYHDPLGGRYADPLLPRMAASLEDSLPYDATDMNEPGFKVMHVQDLDVRSQCARFVDCLKQIKTWSQAHPDHVPILILINAKQDDIEVPGSVKTLPFDTAAFEQLDAAIAASLPAEKRITPDDVRSGAESLLGAVQTTGWPSLEDARGKLIIALDESPATVETYIGDKPSLEGRMMFVNSASTSADHAAYFTMNEPLSQTQQIQDAVKQGFLVRTRADADTIEARSGDMTRLTAALASGAQYVSTDYYVPRPAFSDYQVALPDGVVTRCNPVR